MSKRKAESVDQRKSTRTLSPPDAGPGQHHVSPGASASGGNEADQGSSAANSAVAGDNPGIPDIPGFDVLPADVRERLLKARRDPTKSGPVLVKKQSQMIRVGPPGADDIFRTYPDVNLG